MQGLTSVTDSDYTPLIRGARAICAIHYNGLSDVSPFGLEGEHVRFFRWEWYPKIWALFRADPQLRANEWSWQSYNATCNQRMTELMTQLAAYPTLQGYEEFCFVPGTNVDRYSGSLNNQIIHASPIVNSKAEPVEFMDDETEDLYVGFTFDMRIIEAFHVLDKEGIYPPGQSAGEQGIYNLVYGVGSLDTDDEHFGIDTPETVMYHSGNSPILSFPSVTNENPSWIFFLDPNQEVGAINNVGLGIFEVTERWTKGTRLTDAGPIEYYHYNPNLAGVAYNAEIIIR